MHNVHIFYPHANAHHWDGQSFGPGAHHGCWAIIPCKAAIFPLQAWQLKEAKWVEAKQCRGKGNNNGLIVCGTELKVEINAGAT